MEIFWKIKSIKSVFQIYQPTILNGPNALSLDLYFVVDLVVSGPNWLFLISAALHIFKMHLCPVCKTSVFNPNHLIIKLLYSRYWMYLLLIKSYHDIFCLCMLSAYAQQSKQIIIKPVNFILTIQSNDWTSRNLQYKYLDN